MNRPRTNGFSLIELMIVVAIVTIMILLALPGFSTALQNSQTRAAADSLQNGLRFAQGEAIRLNRFTTFAISGNAGWQVNYVTASANDPLIAANVANPLQQQANTFGNVTVTASSAATAVVRFDPLGRVSGAATAAGPFNALNLGTTTYAVTNSLTGTRRLNVVVSQSGKVRMCDPDVPLASNPAGCS